MSFGAFFKKLIKPAVKGISRNIPKVVKGLKRGVPQVIRGIKGGIRGAASGLQSGLQSTYTAVKSGATQAFKRGKALFGFGPKPQGVVKEQVFQRGGKVAQGGKKGLPLKKTSRAVPLSPQQAVKAPPKKIITVPDLTPEEAAKSALAKKQLLTRMSTTRLRTRTPAF